MLIQWEVCRDKLGNVPLICFFLLICNLHEKVY